MKYIIDSKTHEINVLTFNFDIYDSELNENSQHEFVFRSTKTNYIIYYYIDGSLQHVHSYTVDAFNAKYSYATYIQHELEAVNIDDFELLKEA